MIFKRGGIINNRFTIHFIWQWGVRCCYNPLLFVGTPADCQICYMRYLIFHVHQNHRRLNWVQKCDAAFQTIRLFQQIFFKQIIIIKSQNIIFGFTSGQNCILILRYKAVYKRSLFSEQTLFNVSECPTPHLQYSDLNSINAKSAFLQNEICLQLKPFNFFHHLFYPCIWLITSSF